MNYGFEIVCASVFTVLCIISARLYSFLNRAYTYWDRKNVNAPIPSYIYGTWGGFADKFLGSEDYDKCFKYGKICGTYDGLTPNLLITDPELIKEVVADNSNKFQDLKFKNESSVILKDSLLSLSSNQKSKDQILLGSLLSSKKLDKLIPKLEASVEILTKDITNTIQEAGVVNVTSTVQQFVQEVIALVVFGIELNADVQLKEEFVKNTEQVLKVKSPESIWSLLPFLYENYFKEAWVCQEKVLQYFVNLIISGMSEASSEVNLTRGKAFSLIDLLVEVANEEKELVKKDKEDETPDLVLTDNAIISKCIASMISLTNLMRTSVTLGIYALSNNEEVQEKLYKEVQEHKSKITSYTDIQNLNYLHKVVNEILRLYPFEFRLERVTTDTVTLGEIELDKDIRVSIPLYVLHRLGEYYIEPEKFDPERFSLGAVEKRNPNVFLPFGQAGSNGVDISLQLAVITTKLALFKLIQQFKFSTHQKKSWTELFQKGFTRVPQPEKIEVFAETRI